MVRVTNRQDRRLGRRYAARKGKHQGWCESIQIKTPLIIKI